MAIVVQIDTNSNYYYIMKVLMGRGMLANSKLPKCAEWLKNYSPITRFGIKNFASEGAYLNGYWS
jgi:hypothetical protein